MSLPAHLFVSTDLFDTRKAHGYRDPIRYRYCYTYRTIYTVSELKATLRNGEYAWPGSYQMYFVMSDGGSLSFDTVRKEFRNIIYSMKHKIRDGWVVAGCDINWEDNDLIDDHTGEKIPAAYGTD